MDENKEALALSEITKTKDQTDKDVHQDNQETPKKKLLSSTQDHFSWEDQGCLCSFVPKRYMVTFLAMFGFFNAYALRVNLSVAMVAMVNNVTKFGHSLETEVCICHSLDSLVIVRIVYHATLV